MWQWLKDLFTCRRGLVGPPRKRPPTPQRLRAIREGDFRKGGVNDPPTTPRPQGVMRPVQPAPSGLGAVTLTVSVSRVEMKIIRLQKMVIRVQQRMDAICTKLGIEVPGDG